MSWITALSLLGALGLGIWFGRPRRFEQHPEEIERLLSQKGQHKKVRRHATFINFIARKAQKGSDRRRRGSRKPFQLK